MTDHDEGAARLILEAQDAALRRRGATARPGKPLSDALPEIAAAARASRLAVIVGAGVSYDSGLPMWGTLLDRLSTRLVPAPSRTAFDLLAAQGSSLGTARLLKDFLGVRPLFPEYVRQSLYSGTYDFGRANPALDFVVALADLATRAGARLDIITYNFDDLLEHRLNRSGVDISHRVIDDEAAFATVAGGVNIFHVHGVLKASDPAPVGYPNLVLSEDEFHELMSAPDRWQNQIQASAYSHKDCVFVGLSLSDPNLRRLLDVASRNPARGAASRLVISRPIRPGDSLGPGGASLDADTADALNELNRLAFESLGATSAYVADYSEFTPASRTLRAS